MQYNPDLSPNPVVGDKSEIIKLPIFVGYYFYLLELAFANLKYIKYEIRFGLLFYGKRGRFIDCKGIGFIPFLQFPFQRIGNESDLFTIFISKATRFPSLQEKTSLKHQH